MSKIFSNALFEAKERESAVSPVVGVMLMLVVTIIIAATVSAFAGGLVGTSDKAPQAAFDAKISLGGYGPTMTITHLGGDPIDTARTKLVTSWTNITTKVVNFRETASLPYSETPFVWSDQYGHDCSANVAVLEANVNGTNYKYHEPYLVIQKIMPTDKEANGASLWFGNFILHPGDVMKVQGSLSDASYFNQNGYEKYSVIKNAMLLSSKDVVNVKLVDIPTGSIIYDKDVYVKEA